MSKHWEPCKRCGSNKVKQSNKVVLFIALLIAGCMGCVIGIIIWPLLLVAPLLVIASPFILLIKNTMSCEDCKHSWQIDKGQANGRTNGSNLQ